jgi:conjugal transfer pilus assembly protein TraV
MNIRCLSILFVVFLTGCGPINSNFSCNATAGDSCLTIEQVDSMTRFADQQPQKLKGHRINKHTQGRIIKQSDGNRLWVSSNVEGKSWA